MAIITWPDDIELGEKVTCIVCQNEVSISEAIVGSLGLDGNQRFTCSIHTTPARGGSLLRGWIDFSIEQNHILQDRLLATERDE